MSKHVLGSLKLSGGILSIYCLGLAIVPTAYAQTNISNGSGTNVSQASGFQSASFNSFAPANASVSGGNGGTASTSDAGGTASTGDAGGTVATGTGEPGSKGAKSNAIFGNNRQANIRAAQLLQSQLDAAQSSYDSASARVAQLLANSSTPAATPDNPKLSAVRFALKPLTQGELADCGCKNPDVAANPADNSAAELAAKELVTAKEAQAKAAQELADAQAQARQFLASAKKAPQVSAQSTFSPVW